MYFGWGPVVKKWLPVRSYSVPPPPVPSQHDADHFPPAKQAQFTYVWKETGMRIHILARCYPACRAGGENALLVIPFSAAASSLLLMLWYWSAEKKEKRKSWGGWEWRGCLAQTNSSRQCATAFRLSPRRVSASLAPKSSMQDALLSGWMQRWDFYGWGTEKATWCEGAGNTWIKFAKLISILCLFFVETKKRHFLPSDVMWTFSRVPLSLVTATSSDKQSLLAHRQPPGTIGSPARASHVSPRPSLRGRRLFWVEFELICCRHGATNQQCSATQRRVGWWKQETRWTSVWDEQVGGAWTTLHWGGASWSQWRWFFLLLLLKKRFIVICTI